MPLPNAQLRTTCIYVQILTHAQLISLQSLSEWHCHGQASWTLFWPIQRSNIVLFSARNAQGLGMRQTPQQNLAAEQQFYRQE